MVSRVRVRVSKVFRVGLRVIVSVSVTTGP